MNDKVVLSPITIGNDGGTLAALFIEINTGKGMDGTTDANSGGGRWLDYASRCRSMRSQIVGGLPTFLNMDLNRRLRSIKQRMHLTRYRHKKHIAQPAC